MESLVFVVLFSVVVMAWMSEGSQSLVFVRKGSTQRVLMCEGLVLVRVPGCALKSVQAAVPSKRHWYVRFRGDRTIDSGRGRPLLHLN